MGSSCLKHRPPLPPLQLSTQRSYLGKGLESRALRQPSRWATHGAYVSVWRGPLLGAHGTLMVPPPPAKLEAGERPPPAVHDWEYYNGTVPVWVTGGVNACV